MSLQKHTAVVPWLSVDFEFCPGVWNKRADHEPANKCGEAGSITVTAGTKSAC